MGHPFKKSLFDNDDSAFQAPFLRTDVLSSQYSPPPWTFSEEAMEIAHTENSTVTLK